MAKLDKLIFAAIAAGGLFLLAAIILRLSQVGY
jgi:hypothetical protein